MVNVHVYENTNIIKHFFNTNRILIILLVIRVIDIKYETYLCILIRQL